MHVFIHGRHVAQTIHIYYRLLVSATLLGVGWRGGSYSLLPPDKTGTVGFFPLLFIFTRCISTPWMLDFLASQPCPIWIFTWGLRSVDEVPLNFLMSLVFLEGVLKLSENFQLFPRKLDDLYHMIYSGVSNIISGSDIYPIISWQSLQDLFPLFSLLYWGGLRSYIRRTVSLSWAVSLEVFYQTSIKFCPLKKKVLAGCFPSIQKDF